MSGLLGKLGKIGDKVGKKANELVDSASRAVQHKVNSVRDHSQLRDITVEAKALPGNVQGFIRLLNTASSKLCLFLQNNCGAPESTIISLTEMQNRLHAATVSASQNLANFNMHMEEILKAEQAVDAAEKAAAAPPKPGVNHEELVKAAEASKSTCLELKKKHIKGAITGLVAAQVDTFNAMITILGEMITAASSLPDQWTPKTEGETIPYEQLFDEARPALGNSAAKPPPSEVKRKPHEELALLPRPVDGDTRAKYAKIFNEEIADLLEAHRVAMREAGRWFQLRLELAKHLNLWVDSQESNSIFKTTISCIPIMENQFIERHLPEYVKNYEAVYHGLELQRAPVPQKDVAMENPNPEIPKKRNIVAKTALLDSLKASVTFAQRGKEEVGNFYNSAIGNLPN